MISIIIPCYKEVGYLPRTLKSLAQQTIIKDCEIILSEYNPDFSTYTTEVAHDFVSKYRIPAYVKTVFKAGIAHARNEGVLASRGQYFVNFDADARFSKKDGLERMIQPLEDGNMLTICDNEFDYVGLSKADLKNMEMPQRALDYLNNVQTMGFPVLEPGSCFRTEAFVEVGGFNDVPQYELSTMALRFVWKYNGKIKRVHQASVIVSPRRALKLRELGIGTLLYSNAVRGNKTEIVT